MEGDETPCCTVTAPKPERSGEDLYGVGQNPFCSVCKPGQELQETSDLCNCKQRFLFQILHYISLLIIPCITIMWQIKKLWTLILSSICPLYQILISCNKMEINYLKIIQCDFLDFFLDYVSVMLCQLRCTYDENDRSLHSVGNLEKSAVYQTLICPTV